VSFEPVSGVLARLLRELGLEDTARGWRAVSEWPEMVGPRVASHSRAVGFRDGTLQVEVEGSAWMHELGVLKRELLRTINRRLGSELVRDVRFVVPRGGILR
jgi:predicted nucleic acid-binding Zn ribbon protein